MENTNKRLPISIVSYLIIAAVGIRGLIEYSENRFVLLGIILMLAFLLFLEPFVADRSNPVKGIYILAQVLLMVGLYIYAPPADFWALMLLPCCAFVFQVFSKKTGIIWIIFFSFVMTSMIIIQQGFHLASRAVIFVAAYLFLGLYSVTLKETAEARIRNQKLAAQLLAANELLKKQSGEIKELAIITERNNLSRELHDSVTQTLFSMTLVTRSAALLQKKGSPSHEVSKKLENLQELSNSALKEMRDLVYQLRPKSMGENGLVEVLRGYFINIQKNSSVTVKMETNCEKIPLTPEIQQEMFRVIQEALNNVIKHAGVNRADIKMKVLQDRVEVCISDKGAGFDQSEYIDKDKHFGLENMAGRIHDSGGTFEIVSKPGKGTKIDFTIPVGEDNG